MREGEQSMTSRGLGEKFAIVLVLALAACAPAQQIQNGPEADPNFPPNLANLPTGLPVQWNSTGNTIPSVNLSINGSRVDYRHGSYLGFNDQGSWIESQTDGKIYVWNFANRTLTVGADHRSGVPLDLRNPSAAEETIIAMRQPPRPVSTQAPQPQQPADKSGGMFGPGAGKTLAGLVPPGAPAADIAGTGATVTNGVLTFTLRSGAKSKPYKVARPRVMANNPQAAGVTGAWIAMEDGGKGVLFTVQGDNTVTGKEIPAPVVQMLMQGAPKPQ